MASQTDSATPTKGTTQPPRGVPKINTVTAEDIRASLRAGFSDFLARPVMSSFFGLFYALFGILLVWGLVWLGQIWMIIPAVVAFPLVAPFAAAGLYEMSRRLQRNESFGWSDILTVMADQRKREMGWMAFVTLFILWVWFYQIRLWLAIILQDASFSDFDGFLDAVFFTAEGWTFLAIGTLVGAGLSAVLFAVTVVAMPLLLDRETDFVTAMLTPAFPPGAGGPISAPMIGDLLRRLTAPEPEPLPFDDARLALAALLVRIARSDGEYESVEIPHRRGPRQTLRAVAFRGRQAPRRGRAAGGRSPRHRPLHPRHQGRRAL
jgi:uncharacterized membrane protein